MLGATIAGSTLATGALASGGLAGPALAASGAERPPTANIQLSGAVHARYAIAGPRVCSSFREFNALGMRLDLARRGSLPSLSLLKVRRPHTPRHVALAHTHTVAVGVQAPGDVAWRAGRFLDLGTHHWANEGSGTVSANATLTQGRIAATLVWDSVLSPRPPIHVHGSWDCEN
jgi:hypothetical protein